MNSHFMFPLNLSLLLQILNMLKVVFNLCITFLLFLTLNINFPVIAATTENITFTEEQLQTGEEIANKAIQATQEGDFSQAEAYWSQLIEQFPTNPAVWSNRGNSRVSQNLLEEAIADYNEAIKLAPSAPDPYLNRGIALENKGMYSEAIADYNQVLKITPDDPIAYNNRANAKAGQKNWQEALKDYQKAIELSPSFAFARQAEALTLFQLGDVEQALQKMRTLVRKYPLFPDLRASLTAVLWQQGLQGEAESNWVATVGMDNRYKDLDWVKNVRRWPPKMITALDNFLNFDLS